MIPAIATLPVDSRYVPRFLEQIIDRKIQDFALNILERFIHFVCSWIYWPYRTLYQDKRARLHWFSDNEALLIDATRRGLASIEFEWDRDLICIDRQKLSFHDFPQLEPVFLRKNHTHYVVVRDNSLEMPGWYVIIEQEIARPNNPFPMEKTWIVNLNAQARAIPVT